MALTIVADFRTLMRYARQLGRARTSGTPDEIAQAEQEFESYKHFCLLADTLYSPHITTPVTTDR